jgi:ankyrin repeat protein
VTVAQPEGADERLNELIVAIHDTCDVDHCLRLLDAGLDVNAATSAGCTPLMFAAMPNEFGDPFSAWAMLEMVEMLLNRGADPTRVDRFGMRAVDYARQLIDPDWKDGFGNSAAQYWDASQRAIIDDMIVLLEPPNSPTEGT